MLSGRRILVVEDEWLVLMSIQDMLADLGCESVFSAGAVDQALAMLDAQTIDAAMLDVNLHGERSYPVAAALDQRDVPFMFASGYGAGILPAAYRDHPMLTKPFGEDELAEMFVRIFAGRA